jgi:type II secretory pathway component PulK
MDNTANTNPAAKPKKAKSRRGVVIVAVLVVVAALSLAGYHFTDMMTAEDKAAVYSHRNAQARHLADSGVHFTAAMLSDPNYYNGLLLGNPWNNPDVFREREIVLDKDGKIKGYFSIRAPSSPDDPNPPSDGVNFGVSDEGAKINVNVIMKQDPTGQVLHDMLLKLPNMTEEIANNIVAWMGGAVGIANGGVTDYGQEKLPKGGQGGYRCKFGPIDSIDELLLVRGVSRELLYGTDLNRNGLDDDPERGSLPFERGWSQYLTIYSREQNAAPDGTPYIYINNPDLKALYELIMTEAPEIGEDMAKFIILYRQRGPASGTTGTSQSLGSTLAALLGGGSNNSTRIVQDQLSNYTLKLETPPRSSGEIGTMFDLMAQVSISSTDPVTRRPISKVYTSPVADPSAAGAIMTALFTKFTLKQDAEIPARININTAPKAVLSALTTVSSFLTDNDVENIIQTRSQLTPEALRNPAWLFTDAKLDPRVLKDRDLAKYLTTVTQVYRVQSIGYFDKKGPMVRVEAVIDTNCGRPRILAWRDLSELGKGMP